MDRQWIELALVFQGRSKTRTLPTVARVGLFATVVVLHTIFALSSVIALNGYRPNPNHTALYYMLPLLMLLGGSGATIMCVMAYLKLQSLLGRWSWILTGLAVMVHQFLLFNYEASLIFHILLCSFTALFIVYFMLLIRSRDRSHLLIVILAIFVGSMVDCLFDGPVVKLLAYVVVFITAFVSRMFMDLLEAEYAKGSLQKIVGRDAVKV